MLQTKVKSKFFSALNSLVDAIVMNRDVWYVVNGNDYQYNNKTEMRCSGNYVLTPQGFVSFSNFYQR